MAAPTAPTAPTAPATAMFREDGCGAQCDDISCRQTHAHASVFFSFSAVANPYRW